VGPFGRRPSLVWFLLLHLGRLAKNGDRLALFFHTSYLGRYGLALLAMGHYWCSLDQILLHWFQFVPNCIVVPVRLTKSSYGLTKTHKTLFGGKLGKCYRLAPFLFFRGRPGPLWFLLLRSELWVVRGPLCPKVRL